MPELNLRPFLTPQAVARTVQAAPPLLQPIRNTVFTNAQQHPLPIIGLDDIAEVIENVPVVRRGTQAVPLNQGGRDSVFIEPQGVDVSTFVSAAEMNNWRVLNNQSIQQMVDSKLRKQQMTVRKTTEALCAQSLTGVISYPMKVDNGGTDTYDIDYGSTLTFDPAKKWSAADITVADMFEDLVEMDSLIQKSGWGGKLVVLAGKKAFSRIVKVGNKGSKQDAISVRIEKESVHLGVYEIRLVTAVYKGVNGQSVKEVGDNAICMVDLAAPHGFWYLSIDDLEAGLVALPFFANPEYTRNPSGVSIVGRSKPLPAPVVKAICWATVTD